MSEGNVESVRPRAAKHPRSTQPHYTATEKDSRSTRRMVARWNRKAFDDLKIPYKDCGDVLLFRFSNRPPVNFYPQTGRWRDRWGKVYAGGARAFLRWYIERKPKQKKQPSEMSRLAYLKMLAEKGKRSAAEG